jgi:hypothetical protein
MKVDFRKIGYEKVNQIDVVEDYVYWWTGNALEVMVTRPLLPPKAH